MSEQQLPLFNRIKTRLLNKRVVAIVVLIGVAVIALASFTKALEDLGQFFSRVTSLGKRTDDFVVTGRLLVQGMPEVTGPIAVKVMWLDAEFEVRQSQEITYLRPSEGRLTYRLVLSPPPDSYLTRLGGVEVSLGKIIAFRDIGEDGILSGESDELIAESREELRYLRYDPDSLSPKEKEWVPSGSKGFDVAKNWDLVAARISQASIDLEVSDVTLAKFRQQMIELQRMSSNKGMEPTR